MDQFAVTGKVAKELRRIFKAAYSMNISWVQGKVFRRREEWARSLLKTPYRDEWGHIGPTPPRPRIGIIPVWPK
jgi:hypothetical protein